jgi:8-oxo-dGTP pyrophosphatase MutT (NUDIX family)
VLYEEVRARFATVPARLPAAPAALVPVALPGTGGDAPRVLRWPAARRRAAVLVLFHPGPEEGDAARVVLIERSRGPHRHAGQIAFPGGALEEGESAVDAALREAREEIGLDARAAGIVIAGVLPPVDVSVSGFVVDQVVAFADAAPPLVPDGREVAAVFTAPVDAFLPGAPIEVVTAERDGFNLRYGAYRVEDRLIWGATAGMLGRLGAYLDLPPGAGST